uniref:Uncharacterized protein n=1 Tax=Arundo donax TaxID=35708 RepID=A0A0A8ZCJ5_ARUDO
MKILIIFVLPTYSEDLAMSNISTLLSLTD